MPLDANDTLLITRQFKAPRDRVFAAFSSAEAMRLWLGPGPCTVTSAALDFSVGGSYRFVICTPDGEFGVGGTYREIQPPEKLVFTWSWEDDPDWANLESVISIELHARDQETEIRFTQTGFPNIESGGRHEHGWSASFDKLDTVLAAA